MNKLISLLLSIFIIQQCFGNEQTTIINSDAQPKSFFVNSEGYLTPDLINLLKLDSLYIEGDTLKDAVKNTLPKWVLIYQGINQKERADLIDPPEWLAVRNDALQCIKQMGLLDKRVPAFNNYDYAVCHGAFLESVRLRLSQLIDLWNSGVRFETIVFLTGERTLRKGAGQKDDPALLADPLRSPFPFKPSWKFSAEIAYETEYDMVKIVWDQADIPAEMAKCKVIFVNTPRGTAQRPSMETTYPFWINEYQPKPGKIIATSNPMMWALQQLTAQNKLPKEFYHETVAPEATYLTSNKFEPGLTSLIFDTIAKCLFQLDKSLQSN